MDTTTDDRPPSEPVPMAVWLLLPGLGFVPSLDAVVQPALELVLDGLVVQATLGCTWVGLPKVFLAGHFYS